MCKRLERLSNVRSHSLPGMLIYLLLLQSTSFTIFTMKVFNGGSLYRFGRSRHRQKGGQWYLVTDYEDDPG